MRLRYCLLRIGASPCTIYIDEAVELCAMYAEEQAMRMCPLGVGSE